MKEAVIVSTARTGPAKGWKGAINRTHRATLGGHVVQHALATMRIGDGQGAAGPLEIC